MLLVAMGACDPVVPEVADTIYTRAQVWTGVPGAPPAEALAVKGDRLLAVGTAAEVEAFRGPRTRVVDLGGRFVMPGFIDNHVHFLGGGFQLAGVDLRTAASPEAFRRRLADFARTVPPGRWITGGDWDHEAWGGELPRREWIDAVTPDNPVFVSRLDGHMALANTPALERAGITRDTPDPAGGTIVRDPATGEPTGILKDAAMDLVFAVIPPPSEEELDEALERAMAHAVALGVTQVHDMGTYGGWTDLATYRRAHARGALKLRLYAFVPLADAARLAAYVDAHGRGDDWLRWGGLKGFVDGSLGSTTAWFYAPYDDAPETTGLLVTDSTALRARILQADAAGLHVAVHAIGDRANDWLLDVYAGAARTNGPRDRRFRIEHAQHLTRDALPRFARQGVIPSMQPYHAIDDGRWAEKRIGPERIRTTYAFRSLLDAGAPLTFGSDWTVAPLNPLEGVYAAVTRRTLDGAHPEGWVPEEKVTVEEALQAYTAANAYAGFQEDRLGRLAPGYLADFIVLSENLFTLEPEAIRAVRVLRTVVGGEEQFVAE
ncbi:amidohydrolase [Rhodocaloribacter litoris]|uniref:amidohydrolase n=1 Tax=Rhodocaloribacter litoris TaxID=2558931 RepID=UPI001E2E27DA|nr:amidohydrolase [Rhodocaloribacter litoris]QXD15864.1 amidohydrolase [Rhodocaloribacter litoris]